MKKSRRELFTDLNVLFVQKVLSSSGCPRRLHLKGKYIGQRLFARPELDNSFWTEARSTMGVRGWSKENGVRLA